MPVRPPCYEYPMYNFGVYTTEDMKKEMARRNIDYRDIVSITWIGSKMDGHYQVFYGFKRMR